MGGAVNIDTIIKIVEFKKEHGINDNLARIILHLGTCEVDTFRSMAEKNVIPTKTRCFKDLAANIADYVDTWREKGEETNICSKAKLTVHGKKIYTLLAMI